jgi:hypothetical protein
MAAPALQKTWQFSVNQDLNTLGSYTTDRQRLLRTIKNSLIGFALSPWTVRGSSNGTTAGMDAVDRWVNNTDLNWNSASSAHSWIVLRQAGLGTNIDLLISCNTKDQGNNPRYLTVLIAVDGVGFTGGTTTADPTATETISTLLQPSFTSPVQTGLGYWMRGDNASTFDCALHCLQSSDGQCTRVGVFVGGSPVMWLILDKLRNPVTGLTLPIFASWIGDYILAGVRVNDVPMWLDYMATATPVYTETPAWRAGVMHHSTADFNVNFTVERIGTAAQPTEGAVCERPCKINILDSDKRVLIGMGVYSKASGKVGRHGAVYDLWFGDSSAPSGRGYPSDSAPDFVHWRHVVMPWNGTPMATN